MAKFLLNAEGEIVMRVDSGDIPLGNRELLLILLKQTDLIAEQLDTNTTLRNTIAGLRESVGKLSSKNHSLQCHCKALEKMIGDSDE